MSLVRKLHHVAFAEETGAPWVRLLCDLLGTPVEHSESADGFVERMIPVGDCWLQALEATGDGVVRSSIQRRGEGFHHLAFEVDDIEETIAVLRARGVMFIDEKPRPGGMGTQIMFAHPHSFGGVLVEFVQEPSHTA
ncbi:VOC family protein [Streptosporangium sp. NBC_01755]|uniref:VOC family protein n=1 Tax=unclassified Streptosporangium TaxID=2632669 RepID=UPI002DDABB4F|nr:MULTISPECIES: VOC family protein [unclassified Streptosporangium]WSA26595.1 VOC family protein [Streptosporangium sp. NBC_01810]WSD01981.1 VOC family protein [Streptosporangium sp. NBC_01755]